MCQWENARVAETPAIEIGSPAGVEAFEAYYALRWRLLRAPFGAPKGSERDDHEEHADHVMVRDGSGRLLGVGRVHMHDQEEARIRYMAVEEGYRRRGIGRAIAERLEALASSHGAGRIVLDARKEFVGFYRALGYAAEGPGPTKFGTLEHVRMSKRLSGAHWGR